MPSSRTRAAGAAAPGHAGVDHGPLLQLIGYNLAQADVAMRKVFLKNIGPLQLRPVDYSALVMVDVNPGVTQRQLAHALALSAPNIVVILDRLAARGLLTRVRSELDRRVQNLHLTREGRALLRKAEAIAATMEQDALKSLSAAERLLLIELLQKIAHHRTRRG